MTLSESADQDDLNEDFEHETNEVHKYVMSLLSATNHAHDTSVNLWTDPFSAFLIGIILRFGRNGVNLAI